MPLIRSYTPNFDLLPMEPQDDQWKQRYLSNLDKLEKSEANWRALEDLLRLGMTRVALAAQGVDAELDRHLHDLRGSIRSGSGYQGLEAIVEDISTTVKKIDEGRRNHPIDNLSPAKLLTQLAQAVRIPKTYKKPLKLLLKQLQHDQSDEQKGGDGEVFHRTCRHDQSVLTE